MHWNQLQYMAVYQFKLFLVFCIRFYQTHQYHWIYQFAFSLTITFHSKTKLQITILLPAVLLVCKEPIYYYFVF